VEGYFTAKVSTNVYDTATGHYLLVPQGSTILGHDQSSTLLYGNERLPTISLTRALPDGRSVDVGQAPITDQQGVAGLTGKVDNHWWRLFGAVFIGGALRGGQQALQISLAQAGGAGQVASGISSYASEAIRKLFRSPATRLRSLLTVMKHRTTTMSESVQHKMDVTDRDHGRTRFYITLIVLTMPATSTMPGVRPLHHPAFRQGRQTLCAGWTCLHCDAPAWTVLSHPSLPSVIVILLICKERDKTRKMVGVDLAEQERCRRTIIRPGLRHEHDQQ
jgi:hypothetical protein